MKRLTLLILALGMLCSCTACNEKPKENSGNSAPLAEAQKLMLNAALLTGGRKALERT